MNVIRYRAGKGWFALAIDAGDSYDLQVYNTLPGGRTLLMHCEAWATESGVIGALERLQAPTTRVA